MTLQEFSDEFDIQYDSIAGKSAPGLDAYEKSVYLTRAQTEIIKNYYNPKSNSKQEGFENTEKRRVDLSNLVKTFKTSTFEKSDNGLDVNSKFINLPSDVMYIVYEQLTVRKEGCVKRIDIIPITHDEYGVQIENPFKRPNHKKGWRLDVQDLKGGRTIEIIFGENKFEYSNRYLRYPEPIILVNLNTEFPNEGLSIDNISEATECKLNKEIHIEILNRAVELAMGDYTKDNLETKIQLNSRGE